MANSIRTPKLGTTANSKRIAEAVDNERWQEYRLSMKGKSTLEKLTMLRFYYMGLYSNADLEASQTDIDIRIDNYIKALCRGGQLHPGESLETALANDWKLDVKR